MVDVSIIMPCRNEKDHIGGALDSVLRNDFPSSGLEVLVVDGMSDDGTRDILREYETRHPIVRVLDNPKRIASAAMNVGLAVAKGRVIMRMDAHCVYPPEYIARLVSALDDLGADNVGAALDTVPIDATPTARAITLVLSHPFGVGDAKYRHKHLDDSRPLRVDTVPFGCYRRAVFDRIGLYDEALVRAADCEFNERLASAGGKIFLLPDLKILYYARGTFGKLARMLYQYRYYGPLVDRKLRRPTRLRRYIPVTFLLSAVLPLVATPVFPRAWIASAVVLAAHGTANGIVSTNLARRENNPRLAFRLFMGFLIAHVSYAWGHIRGIIDFWFLKKNPAEVDVPLTR